MLTSKTLESRMKGNITNKLEVIGEIIYVYGCEKFGVIEIKSKEGKQTIESRKRESRLKLLRKEWGRSKIR